MEQMIDIHNHLIPKFDDGPGSMAESLEMLKQAEAQGITDVFATSHFNEYIPEEMEKEYLYKLQDLREEALSRKIKVNIYSGSEIFFHHYMEKTVKSSRVTTLGDMGQYVLLEFPMFQSPDGAEEVIFRLSMENLIPIIAHPERYQVVLEQPEKCYNFIKHGGLLQINGGSILGHFGRETQRIAMQLLYEQLPHFIASDAHSPNGRTFILQDVYHFLEKKLPSDYLEELLKSNPRKIINQVAIESVHLPLEEKKGGILQKIKKRFK